MKVLHLVLLILHLSHSSVALRRRLGSRTYDDVGKLVIRTLAAADNKQVDQQQATTLVDIARSGVSDLQKCEGDCDGDDDCAGSLECLRRSGSESVPGCEGTGTDGWDYCYDPLDDPEVSQSTTTANLTYTPRTGPNGTDPELVTIDDGSVLLGPCEGNCESDDDCYPGLRCHHRKETEAVPGCSGEGEDGDFYCMDPSVLSSMFRLKMYWEEGYDWQQSSREKFYCMECEGNCREGNDVEIGHCGFESEDILWQHRNMDDNGETQLQIVGTNLCMDMVDDSGDAISARVVSLMECDDSRDAQRFRAQNGDWDDYRFELETDGGDCISQEHHPKKNEDLYEQSCSNARGDDTSYWVKY